MNTMQAAQRVVMRTAAKALAAVGQQRWSTGTLAEIKETSPPMFCMQCEQTNGNGCEKVGMCGKIPAVAAMQDNLVHLVRGISKYAHAARVLDPAASDPAVDRFMLEAMFSTLTNVNNDPDRFNAYLREAEAMRAQARELYIKAGGKDDLGGAATYELAGDDENEEAGVLERAEHYDPDTFALLELITYGAKGAAAYAHHAMVQGKESDSIYAGLHECIACTDDPNASVATHLGMALRLGAVNLEVMALLENAHISSFGVPTPKTVNTSPVEGHCILVSGHDIRDLKNVLEQTEGKGINVYTHGELLPAHGYPELQKYSHLVGHYGGAWQKQRMDFTRFPGAIVMTTNCLIEPKSTYRNRLWTRQTTGWPGLKHMVNDDYSEVIAKALELQPFQGSEQGRTGPMTTGFGADAILANADKVVGAIKSGALKHFYVIGGCDGRETNRSYFSDMAKSVPSDSVILTLGCGKFRFNTEEFGDIGGIPRLLDVGQCNDAYGAVRVALALKDALGVASVNDLPISFGISWFEQKAVAVLLTLLYLDVKNIHLGPRLPAFLTPTLVDFLVKNYGLSPVGDGVVDAAKLYAMKSNNLVAAAA
ncbi:Hydroxylamine reductase [Diplonema papillatum]|nr:Hydroxylamine reductase [Diplonema papillatum]|eukprot:gene16877-25877_t